MKRAIHSLSMLALLAAGCAGTTPAVRAPATEPTADDPLVLVMAADPSIGRIDLRGARSGPYRQSRHYTGLPADIERAMAGIAKENGLTRVDAWPMWSLGLQCVVFAPPRDADVNAILARLAADPRVESAQRMNRFELQAAAVPGEGDPYRGMQRSLDALDVAAAHRWSTGRGVRIAVIDTGVETAHPDLAGQVVESRDFVGGGTSGDRHGTAVAGVIASQAGNRLGIVGVAPGARLLALRACSQAADAKGSCSTFNLARAIDYAIGAGAADVINLSLGGPRDRLLERLLSAGMARDVVVVAAAGEGGSAFPAAMDGVIGVSAEDAQADIRALGAPGIDVLSLAPPDGYDYYSGSSMAAAQVSGVVALLLERSPKQSVAQIHDLLARTARPSGTNADARPEVDACAALAALRAEVHCTAANPDATAKSLETD